MNWRLLFKDIKKVSLNILFIIFSTYFILWISSVGIFNTSTIDLKTDLTAQIMHKYILLPGNYIFGIIIVVLFIIGILNFIKYLYNRYKV